MHLVFFNIGWMVNYQGEDDILGNFRYIYEHKNGDERWNFFPYNGKCYAYVPIRWMNKNPPKIDLERIKGEKDTGEKLENVNVVFISNNPEDKETYIIGWYRNATVFRELQRRPRQNGVQRQNIYIAAMAEEGNTVCLPLDARSFIVPRARREGRGRGYGQSPIWYADTPEIREYRNGVIKYIENFSSEKTPEKIFTEDVIKFSDPEYNKKIEKIAVDTVIKYYKKQGYTVKSVEKDNLGYDLIVTKGEDEFFLVEVKGNAAGNTIIRLSPNEFKTLKSNCNRYIIASVINCDNNRKSPELNIYTINKYNDLEEKYYIQHMYCKSIVHELVEIIYAQASFLN